MLRLRTAINQTSLGEENPVFQVLTHIKVNKYAAWRPVFDELKGEREAHSLISERVFRSAANPNEVFIEMDFADVQKAREYMTSAALREGMQRAGVLPPPEVHFLEAVEGVGAGTGSQQVAIAIAEAIDAQQWDRALGLLSNDFTFSGATPVPLTGEQWIGVHRALAAAMPDLSLNYFPVATDGNGTARGEVKVTGTQTGDLALPIPGIPRVPASGKAIANPAEHVTITVKDGKATNWDVEHLPNGGVPGILMQLGVALP